MELLGAATQKRTFVQLQRPTPSGHVQPLPRQTLIPESRDPFANLYLVFDHSISNVRLLSSAAAMTILENITRLHAGEEKLREESLRRIEERSATSVQPVIGDAACRERMCQYVSISVVAVPLHKKNNNNEADIEY